MCLFLGLLRALNVKASYVVPQSSFEKLRFGQDLMETSDSSSFSAARFSWEKRLNRAATDERRLMTIFNHFRDKPARQPIIDSMKPSLFRLLEDVSQNTKSLFRVSAIQDHLLKRTNVGSFLVEHIWNDVPEFDRDMVLF